MDEQNELLLGRNRGQQSKTYLSIGDTFLSEGSTDPLSDDTLGRSTERRKSTSTLSLSVTETIEPIYLTWKNCNVYVRINKNRCCGKIESGSQYKQILQNVSGLVKPGTLLAVLGASGAGKSTLMNILTGRNTSQYMVDGDINVNGITVGKGIRNISAYVQQNELFLENMTVKETLCFRAILRMDRSLNKEARLRRVEEVINEMGLTKCINTRIGSSGGKKGISGGEMKRLSFACEMLTNPPLMFCDEPTSGLDSFMAQNIIQTLKEMAKKGRTILCTIHQPSSEVFALFDHILLLAEGRTAFMGTAENAFLFFSALNYPCPVNFNPADFYILTLAIVPGREDHCKETVEKICDTFDESPDIKYIAAETDRLTNENRETAMHSILFEDAFDEKANRYKASWLKQFQTVFWRSCISLIRDDLLFKVRSGQTFLIAVVLGLVYLQQNYDMVGVGNLNGALFLLVINQSFTNLFPVLNTFPIEIAVFLREYGSGLYRVDVYYIAKILAELPSFVLFPFIFSSVVYWMVGLHEAADSFFMHIGTMLLVANVAASFGYLVSSIAGSVNVALSVAPPILVSFMLFGGFFLADGSIPVYFIWLKYVSWFKYANELLIIIQWEDVTHIDCKNSTVQKGCFPNGTYVIENMGYSKDNLYLDIGLMFSLLLVFHIFAFISVLIRARRSKS